MSNQQTMIALAVTQLLEQFKSSLPQLDAVTVFLPNSSAAQDFRAELLQQIKTSGLNAVIPPWIGTLKEWINSNIILPDASYTVISEQARRLMFIEALKQHPSLFNDENKWQVSLSLLKLFDELNLHHATVCQSAEEWLETVRQAYNIEQAHPQLQQEAHLVHTLWHAWHQQLQAHALLDSSSAYVIRLHEAASQLPSNFYCYSLASEQLFPCEKQFIELLKNFQQCQSIEQNDSIPSHTQQFLQYAFAYNEAPLKNRVEKFKSLKHDQALPFSLHACKEVENEARAIDLQIRQWLLAGTKNIGIISEDRKLARRLRALLERADVPVQDISGWSLATTSAAAVLERWLECVEEDFDYSAMLDFLKSHFVILDSSREELLNNVYRLEKDIIQHEGIARGLTRYKKHLQYRLKKLEHWPANSYDQVIALLNQLEANAASLKALYLSKESHPLSVFLEALLDNVKQLGMEKNYAKDPAGMRIMQTLGDMQHSLSYSDPELHWEDFRTWLGMSLEEHMFSPQTEASPVQLMTLEQAQLRSFDRLVIAAADRQFMPGSPPSSPFFNQQAKKSLGLTTWDSKCAQRLQYFQQLLSNSKETLITYKAENNGEEIPASPWVEALENFHQLSFKQSLANKELANLLSIHNSVMICDTETLPERALRAAPKAHGDLLPKRISAGSHQRLINCPYQFFAGDMLKLKPSDEISEELKKSDYGERIHKALQAFHQQTDTLPAPFSEAINKENRELAIEHLTKTSSLIFADDLEDNILHRSWLHRWLKHIPSYIDWQIQQQKNWSVYSTEENIEKQTAASTIIFGRLDRVDQNHIENNGEHCIIDYKTGSSAKQDDVDCGENIQLTTYSLLDEAASNIIYLILDDSKNKVKPGATLSGEALDSIKQDVLYRLKIMLDMIKQKKELPAWGDTITCNYCSFEGLCRKSSWQI
ncbi:MAG: PD-(D/E)XK nuclease family protein [Gammaproteobacteria bacterium]|nr:PD-(D/E)XK nuclease family protein [Gammaproteobacteria bacterium]